MSPIRMGSRVAATVTAAALSQQAQALAAAVESGGAQLPAAAVARASRLVDKVGERTSIAGSHTVVALAGATGSGKSSLFNALVGAPVAQVGARRPTTSMPTAAVWGDEPATVLLDWLGVPARHTVDSSGATDRSTTLLGVSGPAGTTGTTGPADAGPADAGPADGLGRLEGLVLLDLPDFDSRATEHRAEAQRVLELVDVFVWVTDPQKYADALLHEDYLRALAGHEGVTLVVLNQSDRLDGAAVESCRSDLVRLLSLDGMPHGQVLVTSARTGAGLGELRQRLANAVAGANASRHRLSADIVAVAGDLRSAVADSEADLAGGADADLVEALSRSAGVSVVLDAVEQDYRRAAAAQGGWLFTRWARSLRPDPLSRLRLNRAVVPMDGVGEPQVRAVLGRSSIPPPSPSARSAVSLATHRLAERASAGLPHAWADAVADAASPAEADLGDELDRAVVQTPLRGRDPAWWRGFAAVQWIAGLATIGGFLWLTTLAVLGWLQIHDVPTPTLGPVPWPLVLLVGGIGVGWAATGVFRLLARPAARRRRAKVARRLREAVAAVASTQAVEPVVAVLTRHRLTREHLDQALSVPLSTPR
ncbi:MAG: GTPase [Dermatophilaceae bacterium]